MSKSNMTRSPTSWIALVIGNSRLHWARGTGNTIQQSWHTSHLSEDAIATLITHHFDFSVLNSLWGAGNLLGHDYSFRDGSFPTSPSPAASFVLASVVPQQTALWLTHYPSATIITLETIPLTDVYPTLGIDRALAAYGSVVRFGTAALVMDAGTAFTFTGVDATLRFVGGAILPGASLQLRSLGTQAANLPLLSLESAELPDRWATKTESAMLSGVIYTLVSGIQFFVQDWGDRYPNSVLVLTGGDRQLLAAALRHVAPTLAERIHISDTAVLEGLCSLIAREGVERLGDRP